MSPFRCLYHLQELVTSSRLDAMVFRQVYIYNSAPTLVNRTFTNSCSAECGAALYLQLGSLHLDRILLWLSVVKFWLADWYSDCEDRQTDTPLIPTAVENVLFSVIPFQANRKRTRMESLGAPIAAFCCKAVHSKSTLFLEAPLLLWVRQAILLRDDSCICIIILALYPI